MEVHVLQKQKNDMLIDKLIVDNETLSICQLVQLVLTT